jgi:uncharacterized membrane protein YoaK (UPF0700 family)
MRPALPILMSFNGGYVDTATFLSLQGLFTAHVTGNFVTLGAALALGTSGAIAKVLALPVFCVAVMFTRYLGYALATRSVLVLPLCLAVKFVLLSLGMFLALRLGPFQDGDSIPAIATGMVFVVAMGIQNAIHRIHLSTAPPTTLMTGTTTQMMIDIIDLSRRLPAEAQRPIAARLKRMSIAVAAFASGCALAAILFSRVHIWCFVIPPVVALIEVIIEPRADHPLRSAIANDVA